MPLYIDFETASSCDIGLHGAYAYAAHPTTQILCMAWAYNEDPVELTTDPEEMREILAAAGQIWAHNAAFERLITRHLLDLRFPMSTWRCSMALALANNLPGGLDAACRALSLPMKTGGPGLIQACCIHPINEARLPELYDYCRNDLEITRALIGFLQPMSTAQWEEWEVSERINDRGIPIDVEWAQRALEYTREHKAQARDEIYRITGCTMSTALTDWLYDRLPDTGKAIMEDTDAKSGRTRDKTCREQLIQLSLPDEVREVLDWLEAYGGAAALKYKTMVHASGDDGRVRGTFLFNGAAQTGRFSGRGIQPHNFPRKCLPVECPSDFPQAPSVDDAMAALRPSICSEKGLCWGDWTSIEAVVCPWLAGDKPTALKILEEYASGVDIYQGLADRMGVERQIAKVASLACQFGGRAGSFDLMSKMYRIEVDDPRGVIYRWLAANPWAPELGQEMWDAFMRAVRSPGQSYRAGRVIYHGQGDLVSCELPSGRRLCYYGPEMDQEGNWTALKALGRKHIRSKLWYGRLVENATQAVAADILRDCLVELDRLGIPVIMHIHDEIVVEGREWAAELQLVMTERPEWAADLPLRAETNAGRHYQK